MPRLSKSVRRITVVQHDAAGGATPVVIFERGRGKKKGTRLVRPAEKIVRMVADANDAATSEYLSRHKRSNRKRRDGWVRDTPANVFKAGRKAIKEIRPSRFLGL